MIRQANGTKLTGAFDVVNVEPVRTPEISTNIGQVDLLAGNETV